MKFQMCTECRKRYKAMKTANKVVKKLKTQKGATYQQKQSWKHHIARSMKLNPTKCEQRLYDALKESGYQFARQRQVGPYIVDCLINRLVVEVDGKIHESQKEYDAARDRYVRSQGFDILRFTNDQVTDCIADVLAVIKTGLVV